MGQAEQRVVIIGFGTAAVNALIGLRRAGYQGRVTVLTDSDTLPVSPVLISHYAGGTLPYEGVFPWTADEIAALEPDLRAGCPVLAIDPAAHEVRTEQGPVPYDKCLIATGNTPLLVGFPQVEAGAFRTLRTLADAQVLRDSLARPECRRALVSGTSMVGLKALEACLDQGVRATLLGRSPHILRRTAVPELAALFERALADKGVTLRLGQQAQDAARQADGTVAVTFSTDGAQGETETFDEVVIAHGMVPNLGFVPQGSMQMDQGLLVDEWMRTSDPDVYAAGDVAQALDLSCGQKRIVALWKTACLQGACAGRAMAAELAGRPLPEDARYQGSLPSNTIAVGRTTIISGGRTDAGENSTVELEEFEQGVTARICEQGRLVGFNVFAADAEPDGPVFDRGAMLRRQLLAGL